MKCIECGEELKEEKDECINCGCPKSYTIKKIDEIKFLEETEKRREELKRIEEEEKEKIEILKQEEKIRIQREKEEERIKKEFQKEEEERNKRIEELKNIQLKIKKGDIEDIKNEFENDKIDINKNDTEEAKKSTPGRRKLGSLVYSYTEKVENDSIEIIGNIIGIFNIVVGIIAFIYSMGTLYEEVKFVCGLYSVILVFLGIAIMIIFKAFGRLVTANNKQVALLEELLKETLKK